MKRILLLLSALAAFSASAAPVEDWQNPAVNQRNRVAMHTTFATDSPRLSLDGIWKFRWYETPGSRSPPGQIGRITKSSQPAKTSRRASAQSGNRPDPGGE